MAKPMYCCRCGKPAFVEAGLKLLKCDACGFELYLNASAAVAALIVDKAGNLLVTVRATNPAKGTWDLPGGFVDPGESAEDALRREVKEELGLACIFHQTASSHHAYKLTGMTYERSPRVFDEDGLLFRVGMSRRPVPKEKRAVLAKSRRLRGSV